MYISLKKNKQDLLILHSYLKPYLYIYFTHIKLYKAEIKVNKAVL